MKKIRLFFGLVCVLRGESVWAVPIERGRVETGLDKNLRVTLYADDGLSTDSRAVPRFCFVVTLQSDTTEIR